MSVTGAVASMGKKPIRDAVVACCLVFVSLATSGAGAASLASPPQSPSSSAGRAACEKVAVDGQMIVAATTGLRLTDSPPIVPAEPTSRSCADYVSNLEQRFGMAKDLRLVNLVKDLSVDAKDRVRASLPGSNPALPPMVEFGALPDGIDSISFGAAPIAQHVFSLESDEIAAVLFRRRAEKGVLLMLAEKRAQVFCVYNLQLDVGEFNELYLKVLFLNTKPHPACSLRLVPSPG
jgi:hypothetical protein